MTFTQTTMKKKSSMAAAPARTLINVAAVLSIALAAQPGHGQSLSITTSTSSVDLTGQQGVSLGPNTGVTVQSVTNSGYDVAGSSSVGALDNAATIQNLTNAGGILNVAGGNAIVNSGVITDFENSGTISAGGTAVFNSGVIGKLNDEGTILSVGPAGGSGQPTLGNTGTITTLEVGGNLSSTWAPATLGNAGQIGTLSIDAGGTINAAFGSGPGVAIANSNNGTIGAISVAGSVEGDIQNNGQINSIVVQPGGSLDGQAVAALDLEAGTTAVTVNGSGTVTGGAAGSLTAGAIRIGPSASVTLTANPGSQIGSFTSAPAIDVFGSGNLTLGGVVYTSENNGAGPVITLEIGSKISTITNTGEVLGAVNNNTTNSLNLIGSSVYSDSSNGEMGWFGENGPGEGTINNTLSNVVVGSGYVTLDDTVNLNGHALIVAAGAHLGAAEPIFIAGNLTVQNGAELISQVQPSAAATGTSADHHYGQFNVVGNTTFQGATQISLRPYSAYQFAQGQKFLVVTTAGTASYNVPGITASAAGYSGQVEVKQVGNSLVIILDSPATTFPRAGNGEPTGSTQPSSPAQPSRTPRATTATMPAAIAPLRGILAYTGYSPVLLGTFNAADALSQDAPAAANRAGVQLAPLSSSQAGFATFAVTKELLNAVEEHRVDGDRSRDWNVWGRAIGGATQESVDDLAQGLRGQYGGVIVGGDKHLSDDLRLGGALSITGGHWRGTNYAAGQSLSTRYFTEMMYADWHRGQAYVTGIVATSQISNDESRTVNFPGVDGAAQGDFAAQAYTARIEGGLPLRLGGGLTATPILGMTASAYRQAAYSESDNGTGVALHVVNSNVNSVASTLGIRLEKTFDTRSGIVTPYLRAAWEHEFIAAADGTSASFVADASDSTLFDEPGQRLPLNAGEMTLGVDIARGHGLSLNARVTLSASSHSTTESAFVQLQKTF